MSRTYRAKTGDRWWTNAKPYYFYEDRTWHWAEATLAKYYESDCADRDGGLGRILREHTNMRRRADHRRELARVMKDDEYDFVSRENLYKGFCWHFD